MRQPPIEAAFVIRLTGAFSHKRPFLRSTLTELITPKADIGEHEILAEPFPGTLAQGLVLVFAKQFSGL